MDQVSNMLGYETSDAVRMREQREKKKQLLIEHGESEQCSESFKNRSPELEIELDKEIEKDNKVKIKTKKEFIPPNIEEVEAYILEKKLVINPNSFHEYYTLREWHDSQGKKVGNWKNRALDWHSRELKKNPDALPYSKPKQYKPSPARLCPACSNPLTGLFCKRCMIQYDENLKGLL